MNVLAKLTSSPIDQEEFTDDWHAVSNTGDTARTVCGHALDSSGSFDWVEKNVSRGGITCNDCMNHIVEIKAIKL